MDDPFANLIMSVAQSTASETVEGRRTETIARVVPRAVSAVVAQTSRLVCDARLPALAERLFGVEQLDARVSSVVSRACTSGNSAFVQPGVLELTHPAGHIRIGFDLREHTALAALAGSSAGNRRGQLAGERALRVAVAGVLLEPLLKQLDKLGLKDLQVANLAHDTPSLGSPNAHTERAPAILLCFVSHARRIAASIIFDPGLLSVLDTLLAPHRDRAHQGMNTAVALGRSDAVPIPGRLILGAKRLPVSTIQAVASGDVLLRSLSTGVAPLIPGSRHATNARATVRAAWGTPGLKRLHAVAEIDNHKLVIQQEPFMSESVDTVSHDDALIADSNDDPIDVGELDLPIQFEVDTIALPLSQVCSLRAGYVLELPQPVRDLQVKLVTHGRTIGYGELVSVGEHLGVRIVRMAHGDGPAQ
jgi:type III secretion protein Q